MGSPTPRGAPRDSDEREGLPDCVCTYVMSVDPSRRLTEISLLRLFLDLLAPRPLSISVVRRRGLAPLLLSNREGRAGVDWIQRGIR